MQTMIYLRKISLCGVLAFGGIVAPQLRAENVSPAPLTPLITVADTGEAADPADSLVHAQFTEKEKEACRALFHQLGNEDFELREKALSELLALGPAVLPIADEFRQDKDAEIAAQANSLSERMVTQYDGYLPTSQKLLDALEVKIDTKIDLPEASFTSGKILATFDLLAKKHNFKLLCDLKLNLNALHIWNPIVENSAIKDVLNYFIVTEAGEKICVLRGDTVYLTTPEKAARLRLQKKTFDWSELELSRTEAERVGATLRAFFPAADTEVTTSTQVLLVRGVEACIPRAQHLLALLKPGSRDGLYPTSQTETERLLEVLQKPVNLNLSSQDPLDAIASLAKQNVAVQAVSPMTPPEGVQEKFPHDLQGLAPIKLSLKQLPMGLVLHWLERRAKVITMDQANNKLCYALGEKNQIQLRLQPKNSDKTALPIAGADVRFLYENGAESTAETDKDVRKKILAALDSHLALLPEIAGGNDLQVIRGRLLMQEPSVTLRMILNLIQQWRKSGTPPPPAQWKKELDAALDRAIEWNGHDDEDVPLTGRRVIPTLRKMGEVNLLLTDAPDGSAGAFQLPREDARLLPNGTHTLRALLDELAKKTGASWQVDLGVITITPQVQSKPK